MARGGARKGAGRKPRLQEKEARQILLNALELKYQKQDDQDNVISFMADFVEKKEGIKFFADQLIEKAPDRIDNKRGDDMFDSTPYQISLKNPEESLRFIKNYLSLCSN